MMKQNPKETNNDSKEGCTKEKKKSTSLDDEKAHAMAVQIRSIMQRKNNKSSKDDESDKED